MTSRSSAAVQAGSIDPPSVEHMPSQRPDRGGEPGQSRRRAFGRIGLFAALAIASVLIGACGAGELSSAAQAPTTSAPVEADLSDDAQLTIDPAETRERLCAEIQSAVEPLSVSASLDFRASGRVPQGIYNSCEGSIELASAPGTIFEIGIQVYAPPGRSAEDAVNTTIECCAPTNGAAQFSIDTRDGYPVGIMVWRQSNTVGDVFVEAGVSHLSFGLFDRANSSWADATTTLELVAPLGAWLDSTQLAIDEPL